MKQVRNLIASKLKDLERELPFPPQGRILTTIFSSIHIPVDQAVLDLVYEIESQIDYGLSEKRTNSLRLLKYLS